MHKTQWRSRGGGGGGGQGAMIPQIPEYSKGIEEMAVFFSMSKFKGHRLNVKLVGTSNCEFIKFSNLTCCEVTG